jgi:arabinoxylan arabinofuranohydrolase
MLCVRHCGVLIFAFLMLTGSKAFADYPIMSHRYLADPGSLVFQGRAYLYNSNDDDNGLDAGYTMHSIVCVSSADMKNWTDHGIVFQVPANAAWANNSWAPQPIERDGTIYLYFGNSASGVGVASSTNPIGGFKDAKGGYLVNASTPGASGPNSWIFDPGAFIDDDGQAYLSFGGNGVNNGRIIKLGSDLVSVSGSAVSFSTNNFYEASFLFKRNGIYYLSYSTNPANGLRIDYHTSKSPMTGYTYQGVVAGQPPENENNNHASQFEFNGKWYHAYHNRTVAFQSKTAPTYKRNLALEVLNFEADGKIQEVKFTTDGVPQVGQLDPYVRVEAETMNAQSGIETDTCSEGGMQVTQISNGDWIRVRGVDFGSAGAKSFSARVASTGSGGGIELHLDSLTGTLIATCTIPSTGGAQTWATTECNVTGATGVKDLYLKFTGTGFGVNYWQFTSLGGGTGTGGATATGGVTVAGGATATGGAPATGGSPSSGGASATGGYANQGGAPGLGGALATGGTANLGGASNSGGKLTSGGATSSSGGTAMVGGTTTDPQTRSGGTRTDGSSVDGGTGSSTGSGCSCELRGPSSHPKSLVFFTLLGWFALRMVRRHAHRAVKENPKV